MAFDTLALPLRWKEYMEDGEALYAGPFRVGFVHLTSYGYWLACNNHLVAMPSHSLSRHANRDEAKAALIAGMKKLVEEPGA